MPQKLLSSLVVTGVLLSLLGCSSGGDSSSEEPKCTAAESGAASESVEVTGGGDDALEATFPQPTSAGDSTERSVVTDGDGRPAVEGDTVTVGLALYNGTTGAKIDALSTPEGETQDILLDDQIIAGVVSALECSTAGSVVAAVIPPAEAFGDQGRAEIEVGATDSVVFVAEIEKVTEPADALPRADGADQSAPAGFPTVTLADDGAPTVTIPDAPAPTELQIAVLKKGDGAVVADGQNVTVHYEGVLYETGETFDSSWSGGKPATFPTDGVIPGFSQALVGQTVGSQVIAVIPPAQGYGETPPPGSGITPTSTLVFVVDILAVQ